MRKIPFIIIGLLLLAFVSWAGPRVTVPGGIPNGLTDAANVAITGGTIDGATIGNLTTLNTLYVDGNRSDSYTADGGVSRPYKTVLAALTAINADVGKSWIVKVAPGTYSDNLTITGPRSLRIEGAGVTLSGTILINSGVGSYDRIEFIGVDGGRAEKGPAMTISGKITAERTNDSLIYVGFHGCLISGEFEATTSGTWVLQYENCRVNGAITGTLAVNTQLDNTILIEAYGFNEFVGVITGIVSFYNVNGADIYSNITTTPWFENRFTHTSFAGSVSMIPQGAAISKVIYVDDISYKNLLARTPTVTGATYSQLGGTFDTLKADHIGEKTTSHGVEIDNIASFSNVAKTAKSANVASATTTDLSTATGNLVHITGTTTITAFGTVTAGAVYYLIFDDALTVTHNGTSLICPGAKDIKTIAGARMIIVSEGSGNWRVLNYLDGTSSVFAKAFVTHSASEAVNASDMYGKTHITDGAYTQTLPAVSVGQWGSFCSGTTAAVFSVDCNGSDHFVLTGTALTAGNKITSDGSAGACFDFEVRTANTITIKYSNVTFIDGGS